MNITYISKNDDNSTDFNGSARGFFINQTMRDFKRFLFAFPDNKHEAQDFVKNYQPQTITKYQELLKDENFQVRITKNSLYFGQFVENKKNGIGILITRGTRFYEGEWQNDMKQGKGYEQFSSGSYYDGQYYQNKPDGFGKFYWSNGETYEGEWSQGMKHGKGIWKGVKGDSYNGEWINGQAEGKGVHIWINGARYEGDFKKSMKNGYGVERFANGDTFMGEYQEGKPDGFGEYYWSTGAYYKGQFKNGLRNGKGLWKKSELGDQYEGDYINDMKDGQGVYIWQDGNRYQGEYKNDLRDGYGIMHWNDGTLYKGQWKNGIQDGEGILFVNKETIRGTFLGSQLVQEQQLKQSRLTDRSYKQSLIHNDLPILTDKFKNRSQSEQTDAKQSRLTQRETATQRETSTQTVYDDDTQRIYMKDIMIKRVENGIPKPQQQRITRSRLLNKLHKPPPVSHSPQPKRVWMPIGNKAQKQKTRKF